MVVDAIHPQRGQVVLVNGASGGVGRYAVQLLHRLGVTVIATATPADADPLRELGADEIVDFTAGPVAETVRTTRPDGVDALINLAGYTLDEVPLDAVRPGGIVCTTTQVPDEATLRARSQRRRHHRVPRPRGHLSVGRPGGEGRAARRRLPRPAAQQGRGGARRARRRTRPRQDRRRPVLVTARWQGGNARGGPRRA